MAIELTVATGEGYTNPRQLWGAKWIIVINSPFKCKYLKLRVQTCETSTTGLLLGSEFSTPVEATGRRRHRRTVAALLSPLSCFPMWAAVVCTLFKVTAALPHLDVVLLSIQFVLHYVASWLAAMTTPQCQNEEKPQAWWRPPDLHAFTSCSRSSLVRWIAGVKKLKMRTLCNQLTFRFVKSSK